jgi:hypothetical protein
LEHFLETLAAAIAATQRKILLALIRQIVLVIITGVGLMYLEGVWWWLCLAPFVACLLWGIFVAFLLKWQFEIKLEPPWRAVGLQEYAETESDGMLRLELHLMDGSVQPIRIPPKLLDEVKRAAADAGIELITDVETLRAVHAKSVRLSRIKDIEELLPRTPTAELRAELESTMAKLRDVAPPGSDDLLFALRRALEQTPIYEPAIKEKLAAFAKLLA